jgi:hypothetical protein
MKFSYWLVAVVVGCCLVVGEGCKKKESSEWQTLGARVSLTEFREAFAGAEGNEIPVLVNDAAVSVRYGQYTNALVILQKLANQPSLTAQQKKMASRVVSQVEQLAARSQAK